MEKLLFRINNEIQNSTRGSTEAYALLWDFADFRGIWLNNDPVWK